MKQGAGKIVPFFLFDSFPSNGHLDHALLTRLGGHSPAPFRSLNLSESVADKKTNVMENRALAYAIYQRTNNSLVHAHLAHGNDVAQVTALDYGHYVGPVDALITNQPGCGLTMNYADCSPILLYDPKRQAIGLGHSGWKGAVKDLPGAMVSAMKSAFGTEPGDLIAGIGPSIGPCCYQVGEEVINAVQNVFNLSDELLLPEDSSKVLLPGGSRAYFDIARANSLNLIKAGLEQIEVSEMCTACRKDLFFSHRAENGRTGRFGALLILNQ
ncbi:MAG: peptidoglycan editing factor PgeF [Anaerolineae bacterium]|nr:MAG: peptidoglycan editing factor PgeF [Anaerolineae bacterium]